MKKKIIQVVVATIVASTTNITAYAQDSEITHYGHYKKMIRMEKTQGVVNLRNAIPSGNSYAVGAVQKGLGEITVLNGKIWLDYGKDGIGNSLNTIPADEQAALLVVSKVKEWQNFKIKDALPKEKLFEAILEKAKEKGLNIEKPFTFLLEGEFNKLLIHVINGQNPKFDGHGGKVKLFYEAKEERKNQKATIVGFYSAKTQGVYTHPGESWHLHAVIREENIGAHVDSISTNENIILKLPTQQ